MASHKKVFMLVLALTALIVFMTACAPRTPTPTATPTPIATEKPTATTAPVVTPVPAAPEAPANGASERVTGVVTNVETDAITVQTDDGRILTFGTMAANMPTAPIEVGNRVDVEYTGTIAGTDTTGVTVNRIQISS